MLSGPQRVFCEGIVAGMTQTDAYLKAYPHSSPATARRASSALAGKPAVQEEIQQMRKKADEMAGSAVLTLAEKRTWLARLVRANAATLSTDKDGDLLAGLDIEERDGDSRIKKLRLADKLAAIKLDNDLSGDGFEAEAHKAIAVTVRRAWAND
jgi:phage terminase small subunit